MLEIDKILDDVFEKLRVDIKSSINSELALKRTLWDIAGENQWSDEFFARTWEDMKANGWVPSWLLYVFMAAVRTGDIESEIGMWQLDDGDLPEPSITMVSPDKSMDADDVTVHSMASGIAKVNGHRWDITVDFTAVK